MTLVLLAHPETLTESQNRWLGSSDSILSSKGVFDVRDFALDFWITLNRIYAAPAQHVRQVIEILHPVLGVEYLPEFCSRSMGNLQCRQYHETMGEFPRRKWLEWNRSYWCQPPEGESYFDISERVLSVFRTKILPVPPAEKVLIVAGHDVLRLLIGEVTRIEESEIPKIKLHTCVPYIINNALGE